MKRDIRVRRFYPHPIIRVWRAITDPEYIKRWMQMENDFKPEVGHKFELHDISGNWQGILHCEVIAVDIPTLISYTFKGGSMNSTTTVTITLIPVVEGTRLELTHTGFTGLKDIAISTIIGLGWRRMLGALSTTLSEQVENRA